jgi:anti-sigma factor RsiW
MIAHLSAEQLAECILGQPDAEVARHVEHCSPCRAELMQFREALGEFRGAVRGWSEEQASAVLANAAAVPEPRSFRASHQLAWALLIAAVFFIASFIVPGRRGGNAINEAGHNAGNDALLLNQVDAQVSRTAPSSMEPLMKLVVENQ